MNSVDELKILFSLPRVFLCKSFREGLFNVAKLFLLLYYFYRGLNIAIYIFFFLIIVNIFYV